MNLFQQIITAVAATAVMLIAHTLINNHAHIYKELAQPFNKLFKRK